MADRVRVSSPDPVHEAAGRLAAAIESCVQRDGRARLAIPGGSALAALPIARAKLEQGTWEQVRLTWTDERCAAFDDEDSCRGAAYRDGALDPDCPPAVELPLYLDDEEPEAAVRRVTDDFDRNFDGGLDVVLLGMGPDGHIASLFPGRPELTESGVAAFVPMSPKPPPRRITLTRATLETAGCTLLLATGEAKRTAIDRLLAGDGELPASALPNLTLITDLT